MSWTENKTVMIPNRTPVSDAIDFLLTNTKEARWDLITRSMNKMIESFVKAPSNPPFPQEWLDEGARLINQDWIYREINYLGWRL